MRVGCVLVVGWVVWWRGVVREGGTIFSSTRDRLGNNVRRGGGVIVAAAAGDKHGVFAIGVPFKNSLFEK